MPGVAGPSGFAATAPAGSESPILQSLVPVRSFSRTIQSATRPGYAPGAGGHAAGGSGATLPGDGSWRAAAPAVAASNRANAPIAASPADPLRKPRRSTGRDSSDVPAVLWQKCGSGAWSAWRRRECRTPVRQWTYGRRTRAPRKGCTCVAIRRHGEATRRCGASRRLGGARIPVPTTSRRGSSYGPTLPGWVRRLGHLEGPDLQRRRHRHGRGSCGGQSTGRGGGAPVPPRPARSGRRVRGIPRADAAARSCVGAFPYVIGSDNIVTVDAASTIQTAREHAGLSKRELARRAHTSPAAIVAYESGTRDPAVGTLARIVAATGTVGDIELGSGRLRPDVQVASERLEQVLGLAEQLPHRRPSGRLAFPPFPCSAFPHSA